MAVLPTAPGVSYAFSFWQRITSTEVHGAAFCCMQPEMQSARILFCVQIADTITELKLGNGTSVLIFANIASALPTSVGAALTQAASKDSANVAIYAGAFFLTTLGIVYVQEAERKIPMNYASRYRNSALSRQSYLPFKVRWFAVLCCAVLCCAALRCAALGCAELSSALC